MAVACVKTDTNRYTGTYTGTLTSADIIKEDVEMTFTNVSNKKTLFIFNIELEKTSENQFTADAEVILEIVHLLDTNITEDMVANASATFVFEEDEVTMDMKYNMLQKMTNTVNMRYIGKKIK
jgi:hypothetical protein